MGIAGHMQPLNKGLLPPPPPWNFTYLRFQPIQTKFSHMPFDWDMLIRVRKWESKVKCSPPNRRFLPPEIQFFFFFFFFFVCYHDDSWKVQPIRTKFSHKTFNWNSSTMYENGHRRSHVTPPNRGLLPPPPTWNFTHLRFQPFPTKFSHMTFDWNSSSKFGNGHQRSNVTPNRGFRPPGKFNYFICLFYYFFFKSATTITLWKAQPIRTKFSHMTFDWNSSDTFENGHHISHVTPIIGGFCPPEN